MKRNVWITMGIEMCMYRHIATCTQGWVLPLPFVSEEKNPREASLQILEGADMNICTDNFFISSLRSQTEKKH